MRSFREPPLRLFWDTCLWTALFGMGDEQNAERDQIRKNGLISYFPNIEMGAVGIVYSPCILADLNKNAILQRFKQEMDALESAGYVTILEQTSDWEGVGILREAMRHDVASNPHEFAGNRNHEKVGLGDSTVVYASIKTGCDELWTYDGGLLAFNGRASVRGLKICEPRALGLQGVLEL